MLYNYVSGGCGCVLLAQRPLSIAEDYMQLAGKPALLRVGVRKELSCEGRWFRQCRRRNKGYGWGVTGM